MLQVNYNVTSMRDIKKKASMRKIRNKIEGELEDLRGFCREHASSKNPFSLENNFFRALPVD